MSSVHTSTIAASLLWSEVQTPDTGSTSNTITDASTFSYSRTFVDSGAGSFASNNGYWVTNTGVPSGGSLEFDFRNVNTSLLGGSIDTSFNIIRAIFIENQEVSGTGDIVLTASGTNAWTSFLSIGSSGITIPVNSPFLMASTVSGWPVTSGDSIIQLNDPNGQSPSLRLMAVGVGKTGIGA